MPGCRREGTRKSRAPSGEGGGEDRRLEFEEAALLHAPADRIDDLATLDDIGVQLLAAQIEEPVFQADVFGVIMLAEDRHRQFVGGTEHFEIGDEDLDHAGGQIAVLGPFRAPTHLAVEPHHPFRAQRLRQLEGGGIGIHHALRDAVMVAQIDEQHAAMVADAVAPAGKAGLAVDVGFAESGAGYGCDSDAWNRFSFSNELAGE